jgi:hypothetical protein
VFEDPSWSEEEEELDSNVLVTNVPTPAVPNVSEHAGPSPTLDEDTVKRLTVSQLKDELRKWKPSSFFSKPSSKNLLGETPEAQVQNVTSAGFAQEAVWKELQWEDCAVPEPNCNLNLEGPTVPVGEREFIRNTTFQRHLTTLPPLLCLLW